MSKRKTKAQFIKEGNKVHSNKYEYTDSIYLGGGKPISIKCFTHGIFTIAYARYHTGSKRLGCTLCSRFEKGIEKISKYYDLSQYTFIDISTHTTTNIKDHEELIVKIICKDHGECLDTNINNLTGDKRRLKLLCKDCVRTQREEKIKLKNSSVENNKCTRIPVNKLTDEEVKRRCISKFGINISFDNMVYKDYKTPFEVRCTVHNHSFYVNLHKFYKSNGCKLCNQEKRNLENKEIFLSKAKEKFGDKYDYSDMEFINMSTKIKISCPIHRSI